MRLEHDWIMDVLDDLHGFATANGMADLARQIETTRGVARQELARHAARVLAGQGHIPPTCAEARPTDKAADSSPQAKGAAKAPELRRD